MASMKIKVLGPGCVNCKKLLETTQAAVKELGVEAEVEYVTSMAEIVKHVMTTPGLVINDQVAHQGKPLPNLEKVKALLKKQI